MKPVIMPKFGFTQEESEILEWKVKEGDWVEQGDPLAVVSTDKVSMEVEAPESGIVAGIRYPAGTVVPVTEVIAYILQPGETLPQGVVLAAKSSQSTSPEKSPSVPSPTPMTPVAARLATALGVDASRIAGTGPGGRITRADVERYVSAKQQPEKVRATPAARRLAREQGIDLRSISGSGPRGRIQEVDVMRSWQQRSQPGVIEAPVTSPSSVAWREFPLQGMRKTIAANMLRSWQSIPTIHLEVDVDMEASLALLQLAQKRAGERKVSLTALLVKVVAWVLRHHPRLNAHLLEGDILREWDEVHLGIAVALEDGLIVPVLHHPDRKGVLQIADELNNLIARARAQQLRETDLQNATFTISNLGMFGIDRFTAIINPPQVAILAVSAIRKTFVANESGQPVLHSVANFRLSADHRAVDGALAARFMADLRQALQSPVEMLL